MDDFFIVRMTIVLSAAIIIGLLFTHFYAGHRVKGLLFATLGLTSSSIGFTFATLLPPLDILIYFANILFALGVMLFLLSTQRMIERKANYLEIIIVLTLFSLSLAFFHFIIHLVEIRQVLVSAVVIYLSLSGTDEASGIQAAEVYGVDFVYRLAGGLFEDVSVENYVPKKTLLRFEGLFNGTICYNMYDMEATPAYDGKVYYALRSGNISVQNLISAASGGVGVATTYSTTTFPPRIET